MLCTSPAALMWQRGLTRPVCSNPLSPLPQESLPELRFHLLAVASSSIPAKRRGGYLHAARSRCWMDEARVL